MKYVLDACIAIASMRPREPTHLASAARLDRVLTGRDGIVVPALFSVEVSAGLTRGGLPPALVTAFVAALLANAEIITLGPRAARGIARIAMQARLRAGDAAYVWVAGRSELSLVTDDREVLMRASRFCDVEAP